MIMIGRHIEGITLNPLEYALKERDGEPLLFKDVDEAKEFLMDAGCTKEQLEWFVFEEAPHEPSAV